MPRSSSSAQISSIRSGGSPISPVTWTSRSVPPAIARHGAPSESARRAYAASRRVGDSDGGSMAFGIGGSAPQSAQEADEQVDANRHEDELAGRHRQRHV